MSLTPRLDLRQSQSLVMTPQLMQAIKLLQLSSMDLAAFVEAEVERNPLLERSDQTPESAVDDETLEPEKTSLKSQDDDDFEADMEREGEAERGETTEWQPEETTFSQASVQDTFDTEVSDVFQESDEGNAVKTSHESGSESYQPQEWGATTSGSAYDDESNPLEETVAGTMSLQEHLENQVAMAFCHPSDRLIAHRLLSQLDDAGYLQADLNLVADELSTELGHVEAVLEVLQTFDPVGVFARSLKECLALQLKEKNRLDPLMEHLLEHLEKLARHDLKGLKAALQASDEDVADMISELKHLQPKPGLQFGRSVVQTVIPDVIVRQANDGGWTVELNPETLPRVLVNRTYYTRVYKTARTDQEKSYLSECLQTANWLVKSLDQRAKTVLKVASELVKQQDEFLAYGVQYLRPLNLKVIADAIEMHESTVSRVSANKYIATPRGIFEFKYFFTTAIASTQSGEVHSSEAVRFRIKQLIDQEKPNAILSDDTLVTLLKEAGIDIARRTVAKYREAMHIPSSVERRRQKAV